MTRRALLAVGVVVAAAACGSDQSTNSGTPPLTSAELALHFDTLAGALQASSPTDVRLTWYQDIASILALGVSPSGVAATVQGGNAVFVSAVEIDAFADSSGGKLVADSTYRLAAWAPPSRPTQFVDMRVRFLPAGVGKADTVASRILVYTDTLGGALADSSEVVAVQVVANRGLCTHTALQHLVVPTNPCTHATVDWAVAGGGLLVINPAAQVSGTHLTH